MLRACRSALRPGGRIAFSTIFIADELPPAERRRAGREFPEGVYTPAQQAGLLRSARFVNIEQRDVTEEFLRVQRAYYESFQHHERSLRRALGDTVYDERQASRKRAIEALEAGTLKRAIFTAERPRRKANPR